MESSVLAEAFSHLDPSSRALLHVSLHHRVPDERLARVLRTDLHQIEIRRTAALDQLAGELELNGDDPCGAAQAQLERLDDDAWATLTAGLSSRAAAVETPTREPPSTVREPEPEPAVSEPEPEAEPEPEPEAVAEPVPQPEPEPVAVAEPPAPPPPPTPAPARPRRRRRGAVAAILTALLAAGVLVLVLALTGGDDKTGAKPVASTTRPPRAPAVDPAAPATPPVALAPAPGARTGGTGTARIIRADGRLELELVAHLPPSRDAYEAWLFNSIADAIPLGRIPPSGRLRVPLPASFRSYRVFDISREPPDGNPNHSGLSAMRVRISQLAAAP